MKKTLVPLTKPEMDLIVACLAYAEAHPSHRDIEITDIKEKVLYFSLKDKCGEPTKVFVNKKESKFKDTSTDTAIVDIPAPTQPILERLENLANKPQKRTYNKSKKKWGLQS